MQQESFNSRFLTVFEKPDEILQCHSVDAGIKVCYHGCKNWGPPLLKSPALSKVPSSKSGISQKIPLHALSTNVYSILLISAFLVHSTTFCPILFKQTNKNWCKSLTVNHFSPLWFDKVYFAQTRPNLIKHQIPSYPDQKWRFVLQRSERHDSERHDSLCWLEKSPSLMVCGCSNSPTGAVMLTLNFCSPAQTSKAAGCVVSLKLMPIRTHADAPTPKEAMAQKSRTKN